ncbi:metal-dependent hydrolase family protein [Bifidobacterium xylocopae]|uniref:Imidazolonepropionase n=1 Tax=Bifidobacterium xylocopae TaxID=2493119 RepID=A0A366KE38_9BIFI|nr:amidohydrolase family protein [Bifidobacterium xylocopae]RBP99468.1 imidazolonepropionase [Bifidobacterium xylocopae]
MESAVGRKAREPFALEHANVASGDADGQVVRDMTVVVGAEGRIEGMAPSGQVSVPRGYHRIDATGKVVAPGLINAHTHLFADGKPLAVGAGGPRKQQAVMALIHGPIGKAYLAARAQASAKALLNSGVTTIRTLGDAGYEVVALRDRIDSDQTLGPRILASGPMLSIPGGHGDPYIALTSSSPEEARLNARTNLEHGVNALKVAATGGVTDARELGVAGSPQMDEESMAAVCEEAHEAGVIVAAHAQSTEGVRAALRAGVDTIEHGSRMDDEIIDLFRHNPRSLRGFSGLNPTLSAGLPLVKVSQEELGVSDIVRANSEQVVKGMLEGASQAREAGIAEGVGTDTGMTLVTQYNTWRELDLLVRFAGYTPAQAFHAATQVNARNLGVDDVTGSIALGKDADLLVLDGDPAQDLSVLAAPKLVIARGWPVWRPRIKRIGSVERLLSEF